MRTNFILAALIICFVFHISAQEIPQKREKPYQAWLHSSDYKGIKKGILFDVKDSSLRISDTSYSGLSSFNFSQIDYLKIRRKNNVTKGAIVGGLIGIIPFIYMQNQSQSPEESFVYGLITIPVALAGAGIGAGIGSIKITIPIEGKMENFKRYNSKMNYFALKKQPLLSEKVTEKDQIEKASTFSEKTYEFESYIGWTVGPSVPFGGITKNPTVRNHDYSAKTGYCSNLIVAYRLKGNMGVSFAMVNNQYNVRNNDPNEWWSFIGVFAGPMYTFPVQNKFVFDIKSRIGFAGASLNIDATTQYPEIKNSLALNPGVTLRYNFAKRWCILSEAGYIYSAQNLMEIGRIQFHSFNTNFGIAYRYK